MLVSAKAGKARAGTAAGTNSKVATVEVTVSKAVMVVDTNSKATVNRAATVSKPTVRPRPAPAPAGLFRTVGKKSTPVTEDRFTTGTP